MTITPEKFIEKFRSESYPFYKIYEGASARGKRLQATLDSSPTVETSAAELESFFSMYPDGKVTIVTGSVHNAKNTNAITVSWGSPAVGSSKVQQMTPGFSPGMFQMLQYIDQKTNSANATMLQMMQQNNDLMRQLVETKHQHEIERMEEAIEAQQNAKIGNPILEAVSPQIPALVYMGTQALANHLNIPLPKARALAGTEEPEPESRISLREAVGRFQKVAPEVCVADLVNRLAAYIEKDRAMAENVLNMLYAATNDA